MPQPSPTDVHVDRVLTNIAVAYAQSADAFVAEKVFPRVPSTKQSDKYFTIPKGAWLRDEARKRGPGSESAGGGYQVSQDTFYADVWAFHKDVDEQTMVNTDAPLDADRQATDFVTEKLLIKREREFITTYFTTGVWGTDLTGVNSAPGAGQFLRFNDAASDPVNVLRTRVWAMAAATGRRPNKLILGADVYVALGEHPDILDRIKYTQTGQVTQGLLASLFEVDEVLVPAAIYNSAKEGATDSIGFIADPKDALLLYAAPNPGIFVPSAGYIFTWTGLIGAQAYGVRIANIPTPLLGLRSHRIEGESAFDLKVVATDLGVFLDGAVA